MVYLYDTPGLEDAGGVLDWLETHTSARDDGIERIQQFLNNHEAHHEFNQEAKVLRQVMQSDMAMYVIDAREPVLNKYKDELTILSWCAKPIMPVFNFTQNQDLTAWTNMLARRNLHVYAGFDTVAFDFEGEIRLWDNLATMLPKRDILDRLINMRRREWQRLDTEARREIADFLLDAAAFTQEIAENDDPAPTLEVMQSEIRQLERQMQQRLFTLYRFYHDEVGSDSTWMPKAFKQDPFDSELLKHYGIRTGTGATAGHFAQCPRHHRQNQRPTNPAYRSGNPYPARRACAGFVARLANARPCRPISYRAKRTQSAMECGQTAKRTQQSTQQPQMVFAQHTPARTQP